MNKLERKAFNLCVKYVESMKSDFILDAKSDLMIDIDYLPPKHLRIIIYAVDNKGKKDALVYGRRYTGNRREYGRDDQIRGFVNIHNGELGGIGGGDDFKKHVRKKLLH